MDNIELSSQAYHIKEVTGLSPLQVIKLLGASLKLTENGMQAYLMKNSHLIPEEDKEFLNMTLCNIREMLKCSEVLLD